MVKIVKYRNRYKEQIMELNKKLVKNWYTTKERKPKKTTWDKLTPHERFLHGGPWNDPTCLDIHLKAMNRIGSIPLIIDDSDNVLGMLEYHRYKNTLHIDWMMVDPQYQRRKLGTRLLNHVFNMLKSIEFDEIWTEPEDGVEEFYIKNQFREVKPSIERYKFEKLSSTKDVEWDEYTPTTQDFQNGIGEGNNDIVYLNFLAITGVKYAELFDHPYPFYKQYIRDQVILYRDLPGFPHKSSIMILNGDDIKIDRFNDYLRSYRTHFFTIINGTDTDWKHYRTIMRLLYT